MGGVQTRRIGVSPLGQVAAVCIARPPRLARRRIPSATRWTAGGCKRGLGPRAVVPVMRGRAPRAYRSKPRLRGDGSVTHRGRRIGLGQRPAVGQQQKVPLSRDSGPVAPGRRRGTIRDAEGNDALSPSGRHGTRRASGEPGRLHIGTGGRTGVLPARLASGEPSMRKSRDRLTKTGTRMQKNKKALAGLLATGGIALSLFAANPAIAAGPTAQITGQIGEDLNEGGNYYGRYLRYVGDPAPDGYATEKYEWGSPVSYTHLRAHETDSYLVC